MNLCITFAVDIPVWTITTIGGVQVLCTIVALETRLVPLPSFGEHLFGSENGSTTSWTSSSLWSKNSFGIHCLPRVVSSTSWSPGQNEN